MKMKLIDKYILKQVFGASFICITLFMIIWIAPETLVNIIKAVSTKSITPMTGVKMALYTMPFVLSKALPVGILLGCLYSFNRMSKDSELTVIRGCGIGFWRISIVPIILGVFFAISCFIVCDKMIPISSSALLRIKKDVRSNHFVYAVKNAEDNLEQLVIVKNHDSHHNTSDIVVLNFNRKDVSKVSLLSDIIISKRADINEYKWDLYENIQYIIKYDGVFEEVKSPEKISILQGKSAVTAKQLMAYGLKKDRELTNAEMKNYLKILKSEEIIDLYSLNLNKYIQRFTNSFICILFAILGCLLGYSNPREQKLIGFTIAVGVIFLYYMTLPFLNLMAEKSIMSPYLTATIQAVLVAVFIYYYKKHKGL